MEWREIGLLGPRVLQEVRARTPLVVEAPRGPIRDDVLPAAPARRGGSGELDHGKANLLRSRDGFLRIGRADLTRRVAELLEGLPSAEDG